MNVNMPVIYFNYDIQQIVGGEVLSVERALNGDYNYADRLNMFFARTLLLETTYFDEILGDSDENMDYSFSDTDIDENVNSILEYVESYQAGSQFNRSELRKLLSNGTIDMGVEIERKHKLSIKAQRAFSRALVQTSVPKNMIFIKRVVNAMTNLDMLDINKEEIISELNNKIKAYAKES